MKPSSVNCAPFIHLEILDKRGGGSFGKWLVFKNFDEIDETWNKIQSAMRRGELPDCYHAKCSTLRYNPSLAGPGPTTTAVVCVYTEEQDIDPIGFKLVEIVQHDINYKTNESTRRGKYAFTGPGPVTIKTIFWNNGKPSFHCEDKLCRGASFKREDIWHLNVVEAPESLNLGAVHGRWVLTLDYDELTDLWHSLKRSIESEKKNFGVVRMVCPPKQNYRSSTEMPVFHFYTSSEARKKVGLKLIKFVKEDIVYQLKPQQPQLQASSREQPSFRPQRYKAPAREEVLFWNDGEPDYERVRRKGITKNWRTGEDVV